MHPVAQRVADLLCDRNGYVETPVNRTSFATDLDGAENPRIPRQGWSWCGTFIDWGFWRAGALAALAFRTFGTSVAAQHYIAKKAWFSQPQPGDLAFLHTSGPGHVGFVLDTGSVLSAGTVKTVEGNTSSGLFGSQSNGGQVAIRSRLNGFWAGFGRPDYDAVQNPVDLAAIQALLNQYRLMTLARGRPNDPGAVKFWQACVGASVDGDFGPETEARTVQFQQLFRLRQVSQFGIPAADPMHLLLPATGIVDSHTWACRLDYPD